MDGLSFGSYERHHMKAVWGKAVEAICTDTRDRKEKLAFIGEHDGLAIGVAHWRLVVIEKVSYGASGRLQHWMIGSGEY